jgi:phage terminase small subunit
VGRKEKKEVKKTKRKSGLTARQKLFVSEYLVDMNATQAYLRAGYKVSESVAAVNASQTLRNPKICEAIHEAIGRRLLKLEITNDNVLQEIAKLAFSNVLDFISVQQDGTAFVDLSQMTREQAAAIHELSFDETTENSPDGMRPIKKVKFKLADKGTNLERLGKYLKLFSETTPAQSSTIPTILQEVLDGTLSARDAGYKINILGLPLPEVLRIELMKQEPPTSDDGTYSATPTEELERRAAEMIQAAEAQPASFVPERKLEVEKLKEELKEHESFAEDCK